MTNAEAIETLRANYPDACYEQLREAVDAAIEALKAQDEGRQTMYDELVERLRAESYTLEELSIILPRAADAIEELMRRCEQFQYMPPPAWIPVTERLPEHEYGESTSVLTVDLFGVMRVTYFDGGNWCWPSGEALTTMRVAPITHWMPLPEPPKEE